MHKFCFSLQVFRLKFLSLFAKSTVRFFGFRHNFSGYATVICPCEPVFSVDSLGHTTVTPTSSPRIVRRGQRFELCQSRQQARFSPSALKTTPFHQILFTDQNYFHRFFSSCDKSIFTGNFAPSNWHFLPSLVYHIISIICCKNQKFQHCLSNCSVQFHTIFTQPQNRHISAVLNAKISMLFRNCAESAISLWDPPSRSANKSLDYG